MKTATIITPSFELLREIRKVYCDCSMADFSKAVKNRELKYRAPIPVSRKDAAAIMSISVPTGYNAFKASLLNKLPESARVWLAREYSVCIYVDPQGQPMPTMEELLADEWHVQEDGTIRIWWD